MPYNHHVFTFIETRLFTRLVQDYLSDDSYRRLQVTLIEHPESGEIIPASGGVRKLRWQATGRGKRGGVRVIYILRPAVRLIWMLTLYPKNVAENIPIHVLRQIRREVENA